MAREGVAGEVSRARDVHHPEPVPVGFLLQVPESRVWYVLEAAIPKDFQQWFVVHCYYEVAAPEDEVSGFVEGIYHGQGLPLDGGVSGLCSVSKS